MVSNIGGLRYIIYAILVFAVLWIFISNYPSKDDNSSNSHIEIMRHLNSPHGEYDYYIKNPEFQFLDTEGNVKVMKVLGLYVKIGSPVEITCKVESVGKLLQ